MTRRTERAARGVDVRPTAPAMRALVLLVLAAASQAQPAAEAEALLAAGDSAAAVGAVDAALRRHPDDVALRRLRLRLRLDGPGVRRLPRPLRDEQILDAARALLRRAPADTLALRVLTEDAVWTALGWHDRVTLGHVRNPYGQFMSDQEIRARSARTKFDGLARREMAPDLDRSGRARDAAEAAAGWIETWLAQDAAAPRAYEAAATLAVLDRDWARLGALAGRFGAASDDARAGLYAGLAAYRQGDAEAAEVAFERALARLAPDDRARYEDVRALLPTDARAAYDAAPGAAADAFWTAADPRLLTDVNERRAEHRARVVEADLLFGRSSDDLFQGVAPRGAETAQGRIWVRYGRPESSVRFATDADAADFYGERDTRLAVWDYDDFTFAFRDPSFSGEYVTYSPPAGAFGASTSAANDDFVMQDERMQREDPQRTQDAPETALDVPALVSRFRAAGGGTDAVVAFGVPIASAPAPVRTGAFALEGGAVVARAVEDRATLAPGRVVRAGGEAIWADAAVLRLGGAGTVRVEVEAEGGSARGRAEAAVVPLAGGFGVSDLLLATAVDEGGRGPVVRDGLGIVPAPRAAFPTGDPLYVVVEAYGLGLASGRSRYTVEAELRPEARRGGLLGRLFGRGQGPGVSVRTEAMGDRATELLSFFLDLRDQDAGRYTLAVTVADETTGATASAERAVVLE